MPIRSAGILLFRRAPRALEVFLVHPGGPFWAKKDDGAWSIPKGVYEPDEAPEAAARREFEEETGHRDRSRRSSRSASSASPAARSSPPSPPRATSTPPR